MATARRIVLPINPPAEGGPIMTTAAPTVAEVHSALIAFGMNPAALSEDEYEVAALFVQADREDRLPVLTTAQRITAKRLGFLH